MQRVGQAKLTRKASSEVESARTANRRR